MKLGKIDKNAQSYCNYLKNNGGGVVIVEWVRSSTWGANPKITWANGRVCSVSGAGYCKLSTALADSLRFLGETPEEVKSIWVTGGCGVNSVSNALRSCGWELSEIQGSTKTDLFQLSRIGE